MRQLSNTMQTVNILHKYCKCNSNIMDEITIIIQMLNKRTKIEWLDGMRTSFIFLAGGRFLFPVVPDRSLFFIFMLFYNNMGKNVLVRPTFSSKSSNPASAIGTGINNTKYTNDFKILKSLIEECADLFFIIVQIYSLMYFFCSYWMTPNLHVFVLRFPL